MGKYDLSEFPDANEEGQKSESVEEIASENVPSGGIASWLMENVWNPIQGGIGSGVGAGLAGAGTLAVTRNPRLAYLASIVGAGGGQAAQDYVTEGQASPGNSVMSMVGEAVGGPLGTGIKDVSQALLRRTPGVNSILEKAIGLVPDLKAAANTTGEMIGLPKTWIEIIQQQGKGVGSLVPSVANNRQGALDALESEMIKRSPGMDYIPSDAEAIRSLIGTLRDSSSWRKEKIADPLYVAVMNDLRTQAAQGNVAAQRLLQAGIEINSLNALKSGAQRLPLMGGGIGTGLGIGLGLSGMIRHPGYAAGAALGIPAMVSGGNLIRHGVKNFNPYAGAGAGVAVPGLMDYWREQGMPGMEGLQ